MGNRPADTAAPEARNRWHLREAFWRSPRIFDESLFFVRAGPRELASSRLLFQPTDGVSIVSASQKTQYERDRDFVLDPGSSTVRLTPGSRIPFRDRADLYRVAGQDLAIAHKRGDKDVLLYWAEGHHFHDLQVHATYGRVLARPNAPPAYWHGSIPRTVGKLNARQPVRIGLCGDSISAGANASGCDGVPPMMPPYQDLLVEELRATFMTTVTMKNAAVGGTGAQHGPAVAAELAKEQPDLVVIAFGMNDVSARDAGGYSSHISRIIDTIRKGKSDAEFILIASMLGNPEWEYTPTESFYTYRDALKSMCGEGIALADMTQVWTDLLMSKSYHDLTGNGVNHPNDFGHRIYAQVLLELFVQPDRRNRRP